jgi:hypothetical protein
MNTVYGAIVYINYTNGASDIETLPDIEILPSVYKNKDNLVKAATKTIIDNANFYSLKITDKEYSIMESLDKYGSYSYYRNIEGEANDLDVVDIFCSVKKFDVEE